MAASVHFKARSGTIVYDELILYLQERIISAVRAEHIMSKDIKTINQNWSLKDTSIFLESINHTGAPVVDDDGVIQGFMTLRDIMKGRKARQMHAPVKGYMSVKVVKIEEKTPVREVEKLMYVHNIGHLPVVENGRPIGIISRKDLLDFIKQHRRNNLVDRRILQT